MRTTTSTDPTNERPSGSGPSYGLPRSARVLSQRDFRRIYARGRRAGGRHLVLVALRRSPAGHRLGLSVSKAHGCAVVRNKIKRIFREAFRLERPTLPGNYDLVMIPRQRPGKYLLHEIRDELQKLLRRVHSGKGRRRDARPRARPAGKGRPKGRDRR